MTPSPTADGGALSGDRRYEFRAIALLALGFGLVGLDRWLVMPLAPQIMRDLKLDYQDLGNLAAAVGLSWGVFAILMGNLADRIGRRRIVIASVIGFSLLSGVSGLAGSLAMLMVARLAMGVAEGAYCPASYAAALDASRPERRGLNLGIIQGAFALFGLALGPIIATQLVAIVPSWRAVFQIVAVPGLVLAGAMFVVLRDPPRAARPAVTADPAPRASWRDVLARRNVRVAIPAIFCSMSGIFVLGAMTPVFLTDVVRLDGPQMGLVMSGLGFGGFVGQIALCGISDVIGRRPALVAAFLGGAAALAALVLTAHTPLPLFALLFLAAFCCCGANALLAGPVAGEAVPYTLSSTAMGLVVGLGEIFGGGIAPSIAGRIAVTTGLPTTLLTVSGVLVLGAVASIALIETAPRRGHRAARPETPAIAV